MIWHLFVVWGIAVLFIACIREACNEKEPRWLRILGHVLGACMLLAFFIAAKALL